MYSRSKSAILIILLIVIFVFPRPTQGAQFVISSWSFPNDYGEGIYIVTPYQNSSGSFVTIPNPDTGIGACYYNNATTYRLNFTDSTALRFDIRILFNYTERGFSHPTDNITARNSIRVSVEMFATGERVFYLQEMTYNNLWGLVETGIWYYSYLNIINVILVPATIYEVSFTYEIFAVV